MKKLLTSLLLIVTTAMLFAAPKKPGKKEVILVARYTVIADQDRDFIAKTRGIPQQFVDEDIDSYILENYLLKTQNVIFNNGDFSSILRKYNKNRVIKIGDVTYAFFSNTRAEVYIPLGLYATIPEDITAVYIGSFDIYVTGDDFIISNIERFDEYDAAQEFLDNEYGEHIDLMRLEELMTYDEFIKNNSDDDEEDVDAK